MMPRLEIIEAKPWHCGQLARRLRREHQQAIACVGRDAHRELRWCFDQSTFRRTWVVNGEIAALGGVIGPAAASSGLLWFVMTDAATRYPVLIVKEARRYLDEVMGVKRELATTVLDGDKAAQRLAIFLGFHVADEGEGAPAYSRPSRRTLARIITTNPEYRIPIGHGHAVAMGYHAVFDRRVPSVSQPQPS